MTGKGPALREIIKRRQQANFVGRRERLTEYGANLRLPLTDAHRVVIFNVHGVAGVGKTFLTQRFQQVAEENAVACAYADENCFDVVETLTTLAADFIRQGLTFRRFSQKSETYRQRRHEVESDPKAPAGAFLTKTAVGIGLSAAKGVPVLGAFADVVDAKAAAEQVDRFRIYLSEKFRRSDDLQLMLSPAEVLSRAFVNDLTRLADTHQVALFLDTFERTSPFLETWLLDLLADRYGEVPANLVLTVSGQRPLDSNRWSPYRSVIADVPLAPFTETEARELLTARGVHDERVINVILTLSGCLPVWLATLADHQPSDTSSVVDPSDSAVERFLKWEPNEEHREIALAGALARKLNEDILAAASGKTDNVPDQFRWLRQLPFVTETSGSWRYHDVARAPMLRITRSLSIQKWRTRHRQLAEYHRNEREALRIPQDDGWTDTTWQDHRLEQAYHELCAEPTVALTRALTDAVNATKASMTMARRWAAMLVAAGQDSGAQNVLTWGERLTEALLTTDDEEIAFLTTLLNGDLLADDARAEAFRLRGRDHRNADRYEAALADFNNALGLNSELENTLAGRGETYRLMGRYEEALTDFTRAIELDPEDDWAIGSRGETFQAMGRYEEALTDFTRAIELDPGYAWAIGNRGQTFQAIGRYEEALTDFTRAIELNPGYAWATGNRGVVYRLMGRYDEALTDFTRVSELNPDSAWATGNRGETYRLMGRYEEALTDLTRAIELDPEDHWAIGSRGETFQAMGRYEEALTDLTRAIELSPDSAWAIGSRGRTSEAMGRYDEALTDLTRAIELNPEVARVTANRGVVYRLMGRYDEALTDFTRAMELNPEDDWATGNRGETFQAMGRYEEALTDLTRAIELDPEDSWWVYLFGITRIKQGYPADGAEYVQKAINLAEHLLESAPLLHRANLIVYYATVDHWDKATRELVVLLREAQTWFRFHEFLADLGQLYKLPGLDRGSLDNLIYLAKGSN
ncbi:tetratricopeptide repeat protein [Amycolatopsis pigmentata]|uniref:Tetratricopeptide repeat protein n=1 Tax=Amycolatopsis pigmentata TaxID=450801 RepID=A0ABW5G161_9PSEU